MQLSRRCFEEDVAIRATISPSSYTLRRMILPTIVLKEAANNIFSPFIRAFMESCSHSVVEKYDLSVQEMTLVE